MAARAERRLTREFVAWVLLKAKTSRVRRDGKLEVFFDDTQIEVGGRKLQGMEMNYKGELSYSWQTLWVGPFLADANWGPGSRDASENLASAVAAAVASDCSPVARLGMTQIFTG